MQNYQTRSAVLFIVFNRPEPTNRVFEKIREARPARLYVAADGPRSLKTGEDILCTETREIITKVDWPCEVKTLFQPVNLGCRDAVSTAISWFFDNEEEGIILEDDCLPASSFFYYCDEMLNRYRTDDRVRHIGGSNLQQGNTWGEHSYYFSNMTHVWGWASWRRVWKDYDKTLSRYQEAEVKQQLINIFNDEMIAADWTSIFTRVKNGEINTWDYQLAFLNFFNNSLSVIPNQNLISNIGFGVDATHTFDTANYNSNIPVQELTTITHPIYMVPEKRADFFTMDKDLNILHRKRRYNKPKRRFKRWLKSLVSGTTATQQQ
jgi:hypothetical protein